MRTGKPLPPATHAFDPNVPQCGCYRIHLRRGAPASALRIWLGRPRDPETGQEIPERPFSFQAELNGAPVDVFDFWPGCARTPISREEHDRIVERNRTMDPDSPWFDPSKRIDLSSAPPPSF